MQRAQAPFGGALLAFDAQGTVKRLHPFRGGSGRARLVRGLLGGSWVAISRVLTRVTVLTTLIRELISPPIITPEPPSRLRDRLQHGVMSLR